MMSVGAVAISAPAAFEGNVFCFTVSFLVIQGVIIYLLASVSFYDRSHIKLSGPFLLCYGVAFALLFISLFVLRLPVFVIVLAGDRYQHVCSRYWRPLSQQNPGITRSAVFGISRACRAAGQFTDHCTGEGILSTVSGFSLVNTRTLLVWCIFCLSIGITFLLWSVYFDMTNEQELKTGYRYYQFFVFGSA